MQNSGGAGAAVTLKIVTPHGVLYTVACDSVTLPLSDDRNGACGGSIGIRRGHARAELALQKGTVRAMAGGALLGGVSIAGGFAAVDHNAVTVITDAAEMEAVGQNSDSGEIRHA